MTEQRSPETERSRGFGSFGVKTAIIAIAAVTALVLLRVTGVVCLSDGGVHGYWEVWTCSDGCNTCSCSGQTLLFCPDQWKPYVPRCGINTDQCASDADCCHGYHCTAGDESSKVARRCVALKGSPLAH